MKSALLLLVGMSLLACSEKEDRQSPPLVAVVVTATPTITPTATATSTAPPTETPSPEPTPRPAQVAPTAPQTPVATPTATPTVDTPQLAPGEAKQIVGGFVLPNGQTVRSCIIAGNTVPNSLGSYELNTGSMYEGNGDWLIWSGLNVQGQQRFLSIRYNERTRQFLTLFIPLGCQKTG